MTTGYHTGSPISQGSPRQLRQIAGWVKGSAEGTIPKPQKLTLTLPTWHLPSEQPIWAKVYDVAMQMATAGKCKCLAEIAHARYWFSFRHRWCGEPMVSSINLLPVSCSLLGAEGYSYYYTPVLLNCQKYTLTNAARSRCPTGSLRSAAFRANVRPSTLPGKRANREAETWNELFSICRIKTRCSE